MTEKEERKLKELRARNVDIVRLKLIKEGNSPYRKKQMLKPDDVAPIAKDFLGDECCEIFIAVNLDTSKKINSIHVVGIGSAMEIYLGAKEIFKAAILSNASSIILCHNHPSGDPEPSTEDLDFTSKIFGCGDLLGIPVLDHLIIGDEKYTRFMKLEDKKIYWFSNKF